jgi:hypothetical protein
MTRKYRSAHSWATDAAPSLNTETVRFGNGFLDVGGIAATVQTLLKHRRIELKSLGVLQKVCCSDRLLIREQAIMHFPEPSLVAGAAYRLCSFLRVRMEIERIVPPHVFDLPGSDIVLEELRIRVFVVFAADRIAVGAVARSPNREPPPGRPVERR